MLTNSTKAIVWSQKQCNYCVMAKNLLTHNGIEYKERMIGQDEGNWMKEDFLKAVPGARSVPQIFINDVHIGGYAELQKYFNDNSKNA